MTSTYVLVKVVEMAGSLILNKAVSLIPRSVLVAEDHPLIQMIIHLHVQKIWGDAVFVNVGNGDEALKQCSRVRPDLIVLDSDLNDCDGLQLVRGFLQRVPTVRIVVFSGFVDPFTVHRVSKSPASGFVAKGDQPEALAEAIVAVMAGERFYSPHVRSVIQQLGTNQHPFTQLLSDREMEMLGELGCGLSNEEIAKKYALSPRTIRNHRANIMDKLCIPNAAKLVAFAIRNGFARQRPNGTLRPVAPLATGGQRYQHVV